MGAVIVKDVCTHNLVLQALEELRMRQQVNTGGSSSRLPSWCCCRRLPGCCSCQAAEDAFDAAQPYLQTAADVAAAFNERVKDVSWY
jgi:hypothetical protein